MVHLLIFMFSIIIGTNSVELPSYVKRCHVKEDVGKCVLAQYKFVIKNLINGDKELRIPTLNPFHVNEIVVEATKSLTFKVVDVDIYNLESAVFERMDVDMEKLTAHMVISFPKLHIKSKYDVDGRILILPIVGHGNAELTFTNATFDCNLQWMVETRLNKVQYGKLIDSKISYKADNIHYKLDNLFNGDKRLGDEMNAFLNENWRDISTEVSPAVSATLSRMLIQLLNAFGSRIPFSTLFLTT